MLKDFMFALVLVIGGIVLGIFLLDLREDLYDRRRIGRRFAHAACLGGAIACAIMVLFGAILLIQVGCDFFMGVDKGSRIFRRF